MDEPTAPASPPAAGSATGDALYDHAVVHYSEIGTKSGNRRFFEKALVRGVVRVLKPWTGVEVQREHGRIAFTLAGLSENQQAEALIAVARLPGVATVSPARRTEPTLEAMRDAAVALSLAHTGSFKIAARRSDKSLPFSSHQMNVEIGAAVHAATGREVRMKDPAVEYRVEVDKKRGYVYDRRIEGPGGLPVGASGKVVSLLSGGLDSPVASYKMMVRGCRVVPVHLWNRSFSGEGVRDKILDLARALVPFQGKTRLYLVPFEEIQQEIIAMAPAEVRMLLYRRAMLRVANRVRHREKALATITGDAVGQVASQTLANLAAVYDAGDPPILNPLSGARKRDIVDTARAIGTFEISIRPGKDCCGLLVPKHPATTSTAEELRAYEESYDLGELVEAALRDREVHDLT